MIGTAPHPLFVSYIRAALERRMSAPTTSASEAVEVSGGEGKFIANVTSDAFDGLTPIKRHKLVYACVNDHIVSGELHALTIVAKTPAERS